MALPIGDAFNSVGPCGEVTTLVTNATTTLSPTARAIYVATDGTLQVTLAHASASVTFTVFGGAFLPIRVKQVHACPAGTLALW